MCLVIYLLQRNSDLESWEMDIPQSEADALFSIAKTFVSFSDVNLAPGIDVQRELESSDGSEEFILDVRANARRGVRRQYAPSHLRRRVWGPIRESDRSGHFR